MDRSVDGIHLEQRRGATELQELPKRATQVAIGVEAGGALCCRHCRRGGFVQPVQSTTRIAIHVKAGEGPVQSTLESRCGLNPVGSQATGLQKAVAAASLSRVWPAPRGSQAVGGMGWRGVARHGGPGAIGGVGPEGFKSGAAIGLDKISWRGLSDRDRSRSAPWPGLSDGAVWNRMGEVCRIE